MASRAFGIAGIDGEVEQRRLKLDRIDEAGPEVGLDPHGDVGAGADRPAQEPPHLLDEAARVERLRVQRLPAAEGEELPGEIGAVPYAGKRILHPLRGARVVADAAAKELQVAGHHLEQIVEIMGDAAGQIADRLHLLRMAQGIFGGDALGDGICNAFLERGVERLKRGLRTYVFRHVLDLHEHAGDRAIGRCHRLVEEIENELGVRNLDGHAAPEIGLVACEDAVEEVEEALLLHFRQNVDHPFPDDLPGGQADDLKVGGIGEDEDMIRPFQHRDAARGPVEHLAQAAAFGFQAHPGADLVGLVGDHGDHADGDAGLGENRGIVEVHPHPLRLAVQIEHEFLVHVGEGLAGQHLPDDLLAEVRRLGPGVVHPAAEDRGMPVAAEAGIGVVVDHYPLGAPERHDRKRRLQDQRHDRLQAGGPVAAGAEGCCGPVEFGDHPRHGAAPDEDRIRGAGRRGRL